MTLLEFMQQYSNESACEEYFIKVRWNSKNTIVCPCCGSKKIYHMSHKMPFRCSDCKKMFSVRTNSILAESNIKLQKWLLAMYLLTNAKKGMSSIELSEKLGVTQKTAWFVAHRLRASLIRDFKIGGEVEMDETFIGGKEKNKHEGQKTKARTRYYR